ncbi:MAG: hypothetical protein JW809_02300 [Pirellulales bacterium]|nr:hypothetical protein [Pirellulales bacterium]
MRCPGCGQEYRVRDELAGKKVKCRCGQTFAVPVPVVEPAPMATLLEEESLFGPTSADAMLMDAAGPALDSASTTLAPLPRKRRPRRQGTNPAVIVALVGAGVAGLLLIGFVVFLLTAPGSAPATTSSAGSAASSARWPTPESVTRDFIEAGVKRDWKTFYETFAPETQEFLVGGVAFAAAIASQESPDMQALVAKHGLDPAKTMAAGFRLGSDPDGLRPETMLRLFKETAEPISDRPGFFAEAMRILPTTSVGRQMGTFGFGLRDLQKEFEKHKNNPKALGDVVIRGDTAFVKSSRGLEKLPVRRIDGNWRIVLDPTDFGQPGPRRR